MREALRLAELLLSDDSIPLLLVGESGTGKTLLAQSLHRISSRHEAPFHSLSLAEPDETFAYSTLFGHERDAYTGCRGARDGAFVTAHGGILFLDELGKAPLRVQGQLLTTIESKRITRLGADRPIPVNVRIFAASSAPLDELVASGHVLSDLRFRFHRFTVVIPPLRQRTEDIPALVSGLLIYHSRRLGRDRAPTIQPELLTALQRAPWEGNLRELDHTVNRLLLEVQGASEITLAHCREDLAFLPDLVLAAKPTTDEIESAVLEAGHNVCAAARRLGISPRTVHRHLSRNRASGKG